MLGHPLQGRERVVGGGREAVLGSVAVVRRHDDRPAADAEVTAQRVVGDLVAEHPATTVEVEDDRVRSVALGPVQPVVEISGRSGQRAVDDLADVGPGRADGVGLGHEGPGVGRRHRLQRRQLELRHHLEHELHVGLQPNGDAVVDLRPAGAGEREPDHVAGDDVVTDAAVGIDAADVRQEHPRLAGHVGADVPRVRRRVERDVGAVVDVLHPAGLGRLRGLDAVVAGLGHLTEAVGDPVDVLLDRHGHVRQHRRAARTGDQEQVGEPGRHQPEVGERAVLPLVRRA